jgi:2-oxoglutarate ferredoxin oxidoreductase subunit delta
MIRGTVAIDVETCKGCELCIEECPQESLALSEDINSQGYHYAVLVKDNCTGCVNCALVCPDAVITVYREPKKAKGAAPREREVLAVITNVRENIEISVNEHSKAAIAEQTQKGGGRG